LFARVVSAVRRKRRVPHNVGVVPRSDPRVGGDRWPPCDVQRVETLRFAEVVMAIISSRQAAPWANAAAIARERRGEEFQVHVWLLDDEAPLSPGSIKAALADHGKIIAVFGASHLGKDLEDAFAGNDVMVLK
jgi:hypothetical protein